MFKQLTYLISVVLVLCVALTVTVDAQELGLVGWWKLDGNANDSSGNNNHGTVAGSPQWVAGMINGAVSLDGAADYIDCGNEPSLNITGPITITAWFYPTGNGSSTYPRIVDKSNGTGGADPGYKLYLRTAENYVLTLSAGGVYPISTLAANLNAWNFVTFTTDGTQRKLFLNGEWQEWSQTELPISSSNPLYIGNSPAGARHFQGMIDDVHVYNRALTAEEVLQVMRGAEPGMASDPFPEDRATDVQRDVTLSWTPGDYAPAVNGHRVYLSDNYSDVNNGLGGITVSASSYAPAQRLDFETTYYWRVDEVNAPPDSTVYPGAVWSFTTEPVGYAIDGVNIIATASSTGGADFGPENTINGSGLDENDLHSTEAADMWLSDNAPQGAWIQYEFDKLYKLRQIWVWNSNQIFEGLFGFGLKDVTVEYSTNGTDWTALADVPEFARAPGAAGYAHDTTIDFGGAAARYVKLSATSNWGGVLPQYGLSEVRFFYVPVSAREPSPDAGAVDVHPDVTLSWRAGREAATHDVYLSTDQQAVIDGTVPAVSVTEASYSPSPLDLGSTYYWRVDEVNDAETPTTWQGDVWSFSTIESLTVEGFEDYNDYPPHEIYTTWVDGYENPANGSQVGYLAPPTIETTIVHGDAQSMPFIYSNTGGATYSEATRTFAVPQDWTRYGVQTLGLWFHGTPGNTGQLYVKVNGVKVSYDGDAGNLAIAGWQPWNIDLTRLGTNLASVSTLTIGIDGNGAAGTLYVDDIRLYAYKRQLVTPVEPDPTNLVGHWKFDEGFGNTAADSSGNGHTGTLLGQSSWSSPGWDGTGSAVSFMGTSEDDPTNGRVAVDPFDVHGTGITMTAWIRPLDHFNNDGRLISKTLTGSTSDAWWSMVLGGSSGEDDLQARIRTDIGVAIAYTAPDGYDMALDEWTHVAALWDSSDETVRLYKNAEQILSATHPGSTMATDPALGIGIGNRSPTLAPPGNYVRTFYGIMDDVRIYDRGLSQEELKWLAGRRQPFDKPF